MYFFMYAKRTKQKSTHPVFTFRLFYMGSRIGSQIKDLGTWGLSDLKVIEPWYGQTNRYLSVSPNESVQIRLVMA
jgi:hypothetical protein